VYGWINNELTWLGTEGFGDPESLGDISQWSPSDYTRSGKPSSLADKGKVSAAQLKRNRRTAEQDRSLTLKELALIGQGQQQNKRGVLGKLVESVTDPFTKPLSGMGLTKIGMRAVGPIGYLASFFMPLGKNEAPGVPAKQPHYYASLSQGLSGVSRAPTSARKDVYEAGKLPGFANMKDPKGYSRFAPVDDATPKKKPTRSIANNTTLAVVNEKDTRATREELRRAKRQTTRSA